MTLVNLWSPTTGRELDTTPLYDRASPLRIVACLNVWNDLNALKETVPTWLSCVDHIVAVDGSYNTSGSTLSTDGTREYLQSLNKPLTLIDLPGVDQCTKRTAYFKACREGDYCFIIDADERVMKPEGLRTLPRLDVGWVRVVSPLYVREYGQPRVIRWMDDLHYVGRHHWIYSGNDVLCTHQYAGPGFEQRPLHVLLHNQRRLGHSTERKAIKNSHQAEQVQVERELRAMPTSVQSDSQIGGREALQILNIAYRDDGIAPSRFHTALNRTTPHSSLFFKSRPGPFDVPAQYMHREHGSKMAQALNTADVVHYHVALYGARSNGRATPTVFHHHGTMFRTNCAQYMADAKNRNALVLLSNLELFSWTDGGEAFFLPNTVPVERYRSLHAEMFEETDTFRVAHSPSHPGRKGTEKFMDVCAKLKAQGLHIEPVLIHEVSHKRSLEMKATCHASFDSFWLGLQCSGLECAAMGLPVIAGDETVRRRYVEHYGECPYTFADNEKALEDALVRLMTDSEYRRAEARRVSAYVLANHDEAPVALRYLDLLDQKFHWRSTPLSRSRTLLTRRGAVR